MIVVTVFLSILNQMVIHLVQNQKENCHHDHIPLNVKVNGNIVFSVYAVHRLGIICRIIWKFFYLCCDIKLINIIYLFIKLIEWKLKVHLISVTSYITSLKLILCNSVGIVSFLLLYLFWFQRNRIIFFTYCITNKYSIIFLKALK